MVTPQTEAPELAKELGLERLYFKREDLNPYGSHKGRSIPVMIDMKRAQGVKNFAISSSGNAALAAVRHIQELNVKGDTISLSILVGEHINDTKYQSLKNEIKDPLIKIEESPRPLQALSNIVKKENRTSLRQSTSDDALDGYKVLAQEIETTPNIAAVFIGTSSGTAAQALANYFVIKGIPAAVHIVQTTSAHPIASALISDTNPAKTDDTEKSLADAIVDKTALRRDAVVEAVSASGGTGWIASNDDIRTAQTILRDKAGIEATPNGALGLAGLVHALKNDVARAILSKGSIVCVITGK